MRHRYGFLDPALLEQLLAGLDLLKLFNQLLLAGGGDPEQAMAWMRQLQEEGYIDPEVDLEAFFAELEERKMVQRDGEGGLTLTTSGERRLRQSAFDQIFQGLRKGGAGYHPVRATGEGTEPLPETRPWKFGDEWSRIDAIRSMQNALKGNGW